MDPYFKKSANRLNKPWYMYKIKNSVPIKYEKIFNDIERCSYIKN